MCQIISFTTALSRCPPTLCEVFFIQLVAVSNLDSYCCPCKNKKNCFNIFKLHRKGKHNRLFNDFHENALHVHKWGMHKFLIIFRTWNQMINEHPKVTNSSTCKGIYSNMFFSLYQDCSKCNTGQTYRRLKISNVFVIFSPPLSI